MQTGHEINEIDNSGFTTQGPTVYAANLGNNKYIVQVTTMAVRLLQGIWVNYILYAFVSTVLID